MKLTWFAGSTIRVHVGGSIIVLDPAGISGVDAGELVSGADRVIDTAGASGPFEPAAFRPKRARSLLNQDEAPELDVRVHDGAVLVDAFGEPPLLLLRKAPAGDAPWLRDAVIVAFGGEVAEAAFAMGPRLVAVAAPEAEVDRVFAALRERVDGTALVALEAGLALEV